MTLAWIDLETTGLDPDADWVLEVACIITDDQFNELARFHRVLYHDPACIDSCDPSVVEELAEFLTPYKGAQLAGSTISFDRSFLAEHFPLTHAKLHYRNVDVTALNELARRVWPELYEARPERKEAHRAMSDIEESIAVAKYYIEHLTVKEQA